MNKYQRNACPRNEKTEASKEFRARTNSAFLSQKVAAAKLFSLALSNLLPGIT